MDARAVIEDFLNGVRENLKIAQDSVKKSEKSCGTGKKHYNRKSDYPCIKIRVDTFRRLNFTE